MFHISWPPRGTETGKQFRISGGEEEDSSGEGRGAAGRGRGRAERGKHRPGPGLSGHSEGTTKCTGARARPEPCAAKPEPPDHRARGSTRAARVEVSFQQSTIGDMPWFPRGMQDFLAEADASRKSVGSPSCLRPSSWSHAGWCQCRMSFVTASEEQAGSQTRCY
jgi:hypothetical protein